MPTLPVSRHLKLYRKQGRKKTKDSNNSDEWNLDKIYKSDSTIALHQINENLIIDDIGKMRDYGVKALPTTVFDGEIKVVGVPDFPWICGEDLYTTLKRDYSIK